MNTFKPTHLVGALLAALSFLSTPSRALTAEEQYQANLFQELSALPGTYISGPSGKSVCKDMSAGGITISECIRTSVSFYDENTGLGSVRGGFGVVNGTETPINSFAVGTQNTSPFQRFGGFPNARNGWLATYMSEASWDATYGAGNFDTNFGISDTGAYVYSNRPHPAAPEVPYFGEPIAAGANIPDASEFLSGNFYFLGPYGQTSLYSNFLAWSSALPTTADALGSTLIVNSGITSSVPEPASMAMMATGLLTMFGVRRRRRNKIS